MPKASKKKMTEFGTKLNVLIQQKNLSDNEFAKKFGVSQPNVHAMKYLTEKPRQTTLKKLAHFFKVDVSYFYPNPLTPFLDDVKGSVGVDKSKGDVKVWVVVEIDGKVVKKVRLG